ncbi:MAG TPA: hypothetical protein PKO33_09050 [Pyrinomonadaceae bacterium]|nr:hypothetical protein [Pyrinomonadaceae bacterium]
MDKKTNIVKAICFGLGIAIGLSVTRFVFDQSSAFAGGVGGLCGAMLGLILFAGYQRFALPSNQNGSPPEPETEMKD